ncbi:MAG: hypothetical protein ACAI25_00690, partial [Planctomycetota bacterium]
MRSFGAIAVGVAGVVFASVGCTIKATDHEHHDNPRPVHVDDQGSGGNSSYYDNNSGSRPRNNPPPRNDPPRHDPAPRDNPPANTVWYHNSLPDRGRLENYLPAPGTGGDVILEPGIYRLHDREIKFRTVPGGLRITGSGTGQTIIDGSIQVKGDNFSFKDLGVTGNFYLRGANNEVY